MSLLESGQDKCGTPLFHSLSLVSHTDDVSLPSFLKDKPYTLCIVLAKDQGKIAQIEGKCAQQQIGRFRRMAVLQNQ